MGPNSFSKTYAATLIVFVSFSTVHITTPIKREATLVASVRHFGYSRSSALAPGRVYFDDVNVFR